MSTSNCYIYKIYCKDTNVKKLYIGSTRNKPRLREASHKFHAKKQINNTYLYTTKLYTEIRKQGGWDNWKFEVIKELHVESDRLQLQEERQIFELYKKDYELLNNQNIGTWAHLTDEEKKEYRTAYWKKNREHLNSYRREYDRKNKAKINERQRKYNEKNKDKLYERQRKYNEENKDKINEYVRQKITCGCGSIISRSSKYKHLQTNKHKNYTQL